MDFTGHLLSLPVLSVRQPWASYLVSGLKTVELRTWSSHHKGWLWVHAGKRPDLLAMELLGLSAQDFRCGGLVGLVKLQDCRSITTEHEWLSLRSDHLSPGVFQGPCYGWRFVDALSLNDVIECRGELGLFRLGQSVQQHIYEEVKHNSHEEFMDYARNLVAGFKSSD
jgi:hypothetical protein